MVADSADIMGRRWDAGFANARRGLKPSDGVSTGEQSFCRECHSLRLTVLTPPLWLLLSVGRRDRMVMNGAWVTLVMVVFAVRRLRLRTWFPGDSRSALD